MGSVVILNTTEPDPPKGRVLGLRDDQGILDRNPRLVVVAIQHPLLQLDLRQIPLVHQLVIGMMVIVAGGAFARQPFHESFLRKGTSMLIAPHSLISIPSRATSHPAASTIFRSGESSLNIGLVLLM